MNEAMKKLALASVCAGGMIATMQAEAANWLMLQGTEPTSAAGRAKAWGFIQANFQKDYSDPNSGDAYIPPKLIGPNLTTQESFNISRARIGLRGQGMPLDGKVNYFIMAEFGNNGATAPSGGSTRIMDASVTFNHLKGARVRVGLFKTPGSEEILQGIAVFDYINFTWFANQMLIERIPNSTYTGNLPPTTLPAQGNSTLNGYTNSVAAGRDTGIQIFDSFRQGRMDYSYAIMTGNGNGLNMTDNDDKRDIYLYASAEHVYAGQGPFRQGAKVYAWKQTGKRLHDNDNDGTPEEYDRTRQGIGIRYYKKPFRIQAEFNQADGMIFVGPDKPSFKINDGFPVGSPNDVAQVGYGVEDTADGYYLDFGYMIPKTKWEVDVRYDVLNRLTDGHKFAAGPNTGKTLEMQFKSLTLGVQYHFNLKTRLQINHISSEAEAVDFSSGAGPNDNLDGVGKRIAMQVQHVF